MQTIIHRTTAYVDYPFDSISPALLLELQSSVISLTKKKYKNEGMNLLRCLECYLQITDQQLNIKSLEDNLFIQITNSFIGALASGIFIRNSLRSSYITTWHSVMDELKIRFPNLKVVRLKSKFVPNGIDIDPLICQFKSKVLNEEKLWVWRGLVITRYVRHIIMSKQERRNSNEGYQIYS